jgi:hypothetical protein
MAEVNWDKEKYWLKYNELPKPERAPSPLDVQVNGTHYKNMVIQPAEFITVNNIGFLEGCVIKRMCRWQNKDGVADLKKAIHEIQLLMEFHERKTRNDVHPCGSSTVAYRAAQGEDEQSVLKRHT